tara:strand:+ start:817 stop:1170 length:354 start_codon:yes stop_codon:yes gene_type:complete
VSGLFGVNTRLFVCSFSGLVCLLVRRILSGIFSPNALQPPPISLKCIQLKQIKSIVEVMLLLFSYSSLRVSHERSNLFDRVPNQQIAVLHCVSLSKSTQTSAATAHSLKVYVNLLIT